METRKLEVRKICGTCHNCQDGRCYLYNDRHPLVEHLESCEEWGKTKKGGES